MLLLILAAAVALTDPQVDKIIELIAGSLRAIGEAVKTVWVALSPILIAYMVWRQQKNSRALEENTKITKEVKMETEAARADSNKALDAANNVNGKMAASAEMSAKAVEISAAALQQINQKPVDVHVVGNGPQDPVSTQVVE